ncbi:hypothetical protein GCM10025767_25270 [Thalassotalea piscium]
MALTVKMVTDFEYNNKGLMIKKASGSVKYMDVPELRTQNSKNSIQYYKMSELGYNYNTCIN